MEDRSMNSRPSLLAKVLVAGAGGAAWFVSLGVHSVWPLAWLTPLPLLLLARDMSARGTAILAAATAVLGSVNLIIAYRDLPPTVVAGTVVGLALHFCAVILLWRFVARRAPTMVSVVAYPLILTSSEFLIALTSPHGTAGNTAYSQADVLPLLQLVSITGIWGVSFLLALVPSAIASAWRQRTDIPAVRWVLLSAAVPLAVVLLFGVLRLKKASSAEPIQVGLFAHDELTSQFEATALEDVLPAVEKAIQALEELAARGASIVVLPEKLLGVGAASSGRVQGLFQDAADRTGVAVLAGLNRIDEGGRANIAVLFQPGESQAISYSKRHLVPGLEAGYTIGTGNVTALHAGTLLGIAICKDLDFHSLGRGYARAGIGVMLTPAWDFGADAQLHSRMAVTRAVEGGYALVRCASQGLLTVCDATGRIVAQARSRDDGAVSVTAGVRPGAERTLYARYGDWFAWLCLASTVLVVGSATVNGRKIRPKDHPRLGTASAAAGSCKVAES